MNRIIAILTVVSVIGHAILGCCSHTVHFAASHALPAVTSAHATQKASHSHCHHSHDGATPCDHAPSEDHDCAHAKCQWVASSSSIDLAVASLFTAVCSFCDDISTELSAVLTRNLATLAESSPALPMRSHLALGVLLI